MTGIAPIVGQKVAEVLDSLHFQCDNVYHFRLRSLNGLYLGPSETKDLTEKVCATTGQISSNKRRIRKNSAPIVGQKTAESEYPYVYAWGPRGNLPGAMSRKGERCRLLCRGAMNSAAVEFEDGFRAVVSRNALRKFRRPR